MRARGIANGVFRVVARASNQDVSGTVLPTFVSYTVPNDGQPHAVEALGMLVVTGIAESGGVLNLVGTFGGVVTTIQFLGGGKGVGTYEPNTPMMVDPGTVVSVQQGSLLSNHGTSTATLTVALLADA